MRGGRLNKPVHNQQAGSVATTITVQRFPANNTVVNVTGDVVHAVTTAMRRIVANELMRAPSLLVVDLSETSRIDGKGIGALAVAATIAGESDISFCLVTSRGGPVQTALAAAHLEDLFEVFPTVDKARRLAR